jgi:hypothetical protein
VSQEIRPPPSGDSPPLKRGATFLGYSPPPPGISPAFRNFAPPYKFWIFYLKTKRLQVENIYCVIYFFITRRQNYIHILGFLAAGGVHSRHNHSFKVLRLVSYSTHLKWNHCPQCCRILLAVYIHITYYKNNRLQILSIAVLTIAATVMSNHLLTINYSSIGLIKNLWNVLGSVLTIVHWIVNFPCQCQWCNLDSQLPQRKLHDIYVVWFIQIISWYFDFISALNIWECNSAKLKAFLKRIFILEYCLLASSTLRFWDLQTILK